MKIIGLTGSLGMGKSTVAQMLRRQGVPIYDADAAVRQVMRRPSVEAAVAAEFPTAVVAGKIDRGKLGELALAGNGISRLEAILHPLVRQEMEKFLRTNRLQRRKLVALDIPLLLENGLDRYCDYTLVVSAPPALQRGRVLRRPEMTEAKFTGLLARQMPDREKRRRADFVLQTGQGRAKTMRELQMILRSC